MLNKAIKELMLENGAQQNVLCVAMGQSESTFSRMFMKDDSDPKDSSISLLARRLNIKVSDIHLKREKLQPELCRFFYSAEQRNVGVNYQIPGSGAYAPNYVYINGEWREYTEMKSSTDSSNFDDVIYLGEVPRWHIKVDGRVQCPDLYKQLCDEAKNK